MAILVAAIFKDEALAVDAMDSLRRAGFGDDDMRHFFTGSSAPGEGGSHERPEGIVVAINASVAADIDLVIDLMRESGACFVERDHGEWRDGRWVDYDPERPPEKIEIDLRRALRPALLDRSPGPIAYTGLHRLSH